MFGLGRCLTGSIKRSLGVATLVRHTRLAKPQARVGGGLGALARQQPRTTRFQIQSKQQYHAGGRGITNDQVIYGLIGANVGVFVLWKTMNPYFMMKHFTCSADGLTIHHRWHTLVTCTFSHENIWHLMVNMIGLYFFGSELVVYMGARSFLTMYLASGVVSSAAQVYANHQKRFRSILLGASGAVNSVIAFSVLEWPRRLILVYGIIPVPAMLFGIFVMFQDAFGAVESSSSGIRLQTSTGVGYVAHLAGAAVGAAFWSVSKGRRFRRF